MYYSATIVEMTGLSSSRTTNIWIAVAINAVNFLFSFPGKQSRIKKSSLQYCNNAQEVGFTCAQRGILEETKVFFSYLIVKFVFSFPGEQSHQGRF
jgi:hypothetical protein